MSGSLKKDTVDSLSGAQIPSRTNDERECFIFLPTFVEKKKKRNLPFISWNTF